MRAVGKEKIVRAIHGEQRPFRFIVNVASAVAAAVGLCVSSGAHAADGGSRTPHRLVLTPKDLDRVTAGSLSLRIDADASAHGTIAFATALTSFETTFGQALMVHVDRSPNPGAPSVMGTQELAVTRGKGSAYAAGDQGADCSVTATILISDLVASMISSDKVLTATTALCQCSLLMVSVVH